MFRNQTTVKVIFSIGQSTISICRLPDDFLKGACLVVKPSNHVHITWAQFGFRLQEPVKWNLKLARVSRLK
jgi:hypothetical protein